MAELLYPLSGDFRGPWLIDFQRLEELDRILDTTWTRLLAHRDERIKQETDKESQKIPVGKREAERKWIEQRATANVEYKPPSRALNIKFRSGKSLKASSFKEASLERAIQDELPSAFSVRMTAARIEIEMDLERYTDHRLSFSVAPANTTISKEIAHDIERWVKANRPARWVSFWRASGATIWYPFMLILFLSLAFFTTDVDTYKKQLKAEARELLKGGLSEQEKSRALEILVTLESDYVPADFPQTARPSTSWFWWLAGIGGLVCTLISFPPRTHFGLGKGENRIKI
jgi:hypothetical protein